MKMKSIVCVSWTTGQCANQYCHLVFASLNKSWSSIDIHKKIHVVFDTDAAVLFENFH